MRTITAITLFFLRIWTSWKLKESDFEVNSVIISKKYTFLLTSGSSRDFQDGLEITIFGIYIGSKSL